MSAITAPPRTSPAPQSHRGSAPSEGDQRIVIRGVSWDLYDRLSEAIGEGQHVRLAFDGEDLEIMTTGRLHEIYKEMLGYMVATVSRALGIPRAKLGETTWKRPEVARGIQADNCYYFDAAKLAVDKAARARKSNDIADYPNPDLAIEVDIPGPKVDRSAIYSQLRVAEVWRFDGETVVIEHLQADGSYVGGERSLFLPLSAEDVRQWLVDEDSSDEPAWELRLEEWALGLERRS